MVVFKKIIMLQGSIFSCFWQRSLSSGVCGCVGGVGPLVQGFSETSISPTHAARYQVPLGVSTRMAVAYYHRAITLDPTNGKHCGRDLSRPDPVRVLCWMRRAGREVIHITGV